MAAKRSTTQRKSAARKTSAGAKPKSRRTTAAKKKKKPAAKAKPTGRKTAPAKRRRAQGRKPATNVPVRLITPRAPKKSKGPPPPPSDAVEVSGIYERVMFSENDPYQEVREVFGHYDRDKSGSIEATEFARICEALGVTLDEEELEVGLSIVDADGDGKITWDEFLGWWRSR